MKSKWMSNGLIVAAMATVSVVAIAGQASRQAVTVRGGESGLVGIKLYDTGTRVLKVYGNPTEIQPVSFGGGAIGPAAGGGGGPAGARGPMGGPAGGGGGAAATAAVSHNPHEFGFGDEILFQGGRRGGGVDPEEGGGRQGGPPPGVGGFPGAPGGNPGGAAPGGGRPGGMAPGGGGGGNAGKILYTRWVYKRGPSKYGFILDKFNRVVQVEAIGMADSRVKTSKGIRFGSSFKTVMEKYQTPDGYEISGDNIVVRYLVRNKVAFRLSRLGENKPHVVTGIVVAGGKT